MIVCRKFTETSLENIRLFYDDTTADVSTFLRRGSIRQKAVSRSQLLQAIWNWNFDQWFMFAKGKDMQNLESTTHLTCILHVSLQITKNVYILGSTNGNYFKIRSKMSHKKSNQLLPLFIGHVGSLYFTDQNIYILQSGL